MLTLWLPVLVSAVIVFIVSSAIHMASPWHKNDFPRLANEDAVLDALRPLNIPPGDYMMPRPQSREDLRSTEFAEKRRQGPVLVMTVMPSGTMSMRGSLIQWFIYLIVVGLIAGHVASGALPAGASGEHVFHAVALTAFAAYALALWQLSIWYRRSWSITIKATIDGLIYAAITGAVFAWLWPH
jgi:hypothetical protein